MDALDTEDQAKFADGLKDIADELKNTSSSGADALNKLQSGEVGSAMAKQDSCKSPAASSSPGSGAPASKAKAS